MLCNVTRNSRKSSLSFRFVVSCCATSRDMTGFIFFIPVRCLVLYNVAWKHRMSWLSDDAPAFGDAELLSAFMWRRTSTLAKLSAFNLNVQQLPRTVIKRTNVLHTRLPQYLPQYLSQNLPQYVINWSELSRFYVGAFTNRNFLTDFFPPFQLAPLSGWVCVQISMDFVAKQMVGKQLGAVKGKTFVLFFLHKMLKT